MGYKTNLELAYHMGYGDALARRMPDMDKVAVLNEDVCHADETDTWECVCDGIGHYGERMTIHVMECDKCGHTYEHVNGSYEYCPHCGRRVVEESDD